MIAMRRKARVRWGCAVALAVGALARPRGAYAQTRDDANALGHALVEALSPQIETTAPETWGDRNAVGVRVVGSPPEAVEAVARGVVEALSSHLHATRLSAGDDLTSAASAARQAGAPRLLRVVVSSAQGPLHGAAQLVVVDAGPWQTFLAQEPAAPVTVASLERDATSAPAVTPPAATPRWPAPGRPRVVATPFHATVAPSALDLNGDGRDELVIVTADRVRVARMAGASLAFVREAPGAQLPRASVPLRQPLGSAARDASRRIVRYRTSQFATMAEVSLEGDLARVRRVDGDQYPAAGFGCVALRAGSHLVASVSSSCDAATTASVQGAVAAVPVAYDEVAGATHHRWELRTTGDGRGDLRRDGAPFDTLNDAASPASLEDLDGDGHPELIVASASAPGAPDRVRVYTLSERAEERNVFVLAVPGSAEALTVGDLDGDGRRELVVSVLDPARHASTLWIVP